MGRDTLTDFFHDISSLPGPFIVFDDGYRPRSYTYRQMAAMAQAFAGRLASHGVVQGEKVLIWSENRPGWIAALWGCILEGVIAVPLDYRTSGEFLQRIASVTASRALVAGDQVSVPPALGIETWTMREVETDFSDTHRARKVAMPDDTVEIVFTSGATAEPKGVIITHRNLLANMVPVEREIQKYKKYGKPFFPIRFLNLLPLSHLFGQSMAAFIPPMLGGVVVFMRSLDPGEITRQVRQRRISVIVCVPKMLEVLRGYVEGRYPEVREPAGAGKWWMRWWQYRRLHRAFGFKFWAFVVGAAPLAPELEDHWSHLGFIVIQGYGLTETAPIVTLNHPFHARRGAVGKPIAGVQVQIADDGEILVRGANVSSGYFESSAGDDSRYTSDGWLRTGDLGEKLPDGNLVIRGRKKDVIVSPEGLNVYPEDIEKVLEQIPGVKEAAVVGPDRVHAMIVPSSNADLEEIQRTVNRQLEEHQKIRSIHLWPEPELPRTEGTGKLKRAAVREWLDRGSTPQPRRSEGGLLSALRELAPGRTITADTRLDELGLSSLERIQLMTAIEQQTGSARDESALANVERVSDLLNLPAAAAPSAEDYPHWSQSALARAWRRVVLPFLVLPLTRYYARIKVRGREHLQGIGSPVIFAANHQSHIDTPIIFAALPSSLRYRVAPAMAKEFFAAHFHPASHKFGERSIRSLQYYLAVLTFNAFPLPQRESGVNDTLHYAGELAASGSSILIYPEGKRTDHGDISAFKPGVALMAERLSLPVVPVRIRGAERVLHKDARHASHAAVEVVFGPPLTLSGQDLRQLARLVQEAVERL